MSIVRSSAAGLIYATLMTLGAMYREESFRQSHLLGFVFYAVAFGVVFHLLMSWIVKRKMSKKD